MANLKVLKKNKKATHSYFAVKSQNEIYYKMASIFKQAAADEASLAERIIFKSIAEQAPNISLENFV